MHGWAISTNILLRFRALFASPQMDDSATIVGVISLLFVSALLACYVPARRATRVDPTAALRDQ